ncbi:hypothetical protein ATKI12_4879 [Kitasatospora sp. Ki12]
MGEADGAFRREPGPVEFIRTPGIDFPSALSPSAGPEGKQS